MGIKLYYLATFSFSNVLCTSFDVSHDLISLVFNGCIVFPCIIYLLFSSLVLYKFLLFQIMQLSNPCIQIFVHSASVCVEKFLKPELSHVFFRFDLILLPHSLPHCILFFLQMRIKWTEMSTVYAGPFSKNCNLRALKRLFKSFGPIRSMTLVLETHQVMR